MQNLKVDIIYHQSPSDFEMEFNLGSSCPMRTLSDRTTDKKSFIKALVRDVARSRVIICCGPLFGSEGLVSIVARAIGSGTAVCDNKTYGINSDEQIDIIKDSIPLVTPDGYFGGCIIESGPQTIILLTENKTFRKVIMKNLIHPYMAEISYVVPNSTVDSIPNSTNDTEYNPAVTETETYIAQKDDDYNNDDETQEQQSQLPADNDDDDNIKFVMDNDDIDQDDVDEETVEDDTYLNLYTAVNTDDVDEGTEDLYTTSESDELFIGKTEQDAQDKKHAKKESMRTMDIIIVALVSLLVLAILALAYLMFLRPLSMGVEVGEYLKEIFGLVSGNTMV